MLTKPLGVGILMTAAKAGLADGAVTDRVCRQMAALNRAARDILVCHTVHACTDVTGFALLGHSFEMAQGSGCSLHIDAASVPFHPEAYEFAEMGFIPAGAYRNREYAEAGVKAAPTVTRATLDIFYDPQTSGGLLAALPAQDAERAARELQDAGIPAAVVGYVTEQEDYSVFVE